MANNNNNFIRKLRISRTELTQDEVAKEIGVSAITIRTLETGKKEAASLNALTACKLAKLFNVSVPELLELEPIVSDEEDTKLMQEFMGFLSFRKGNPKIKTPVADFSYLEEISKEEGYERKEMQFGETLCNIILDKAQRCVEIRTKTGKLLGCVYEDELDTSLEEYFENIF